MSMAKQQNPPDPYQHQRDPSDNEIQDAKRFDEKHQVDPFLAENPTRGGRISLYAVAIAIVLGALFYGFSSTGPNQTSSTSTPPASPSTAQNNAAKPPVGAGIRDVTPSNAQQGVTTGMAPSGSTPQAHPQSGNTQDSGAK
jgi:hypothetical protein